MKKGIEIDSIKNHKSSNKQRKSVDKLKKIRDEKLKNITQEFKIGINYPIPKEKVFNYKYDNKNKIFDMNNSNGLKCLLDSKDFYYIGSKGLDKLIN